MNVINTAGSGFNFTPFALFLCYVHNMQSSKSKKTKVGNSTESEAGKF